MSRYVCIEFGLAKGSDACCSEWHDLSCCAVAPLVAAGSRALSADPTSAGCDALQVAETPAAAPAPKASQFPPAMRAYVERAFLAAKTPEQKKLMTPALKAVIDAASTKGELWMTNWDTLPLPSIAALAANGGAAAAGAGAVDSLQGGCRPSCMHVHIG